MSTSAPTNIITQYVISPSTLPRASPGHSADDLDIKISKYKDIDLQFDGSRESMLLDQVLAAFQETSVEKFATALAEFDRVIRLDAWKTKILLEAKRRLESMAVGGGSEDDDDVQ